MGLGQRRAGAAVGVLAWAAALALLAHAPVGGAESVQGHPDGGSSGRDSAEARAMWAATRSSSGPGKHTRLGLKTDEARTSLVPRKPPAEIAPFPPMQWHSW